MEKRYGRAQFLRDALSLGLPVHLAFSRTALRRQRDHLIREHHPDRGGNNDRAREINEVYARMIRWLDRGSMGGDADCLQLCRVSEVEAILRSRRRLKARSFSPSPGRTTSV